MSWWWGWVAEWGRAGRGKWRQMKESLHGIDPHRAPTGWGGDCCCSPSPHAFPNQRHTVPAWRPVLSSQWDLSCYLLLEAWKSWLTYFSSPSSKHTFAQLFSHLLHFCATFIGLLRDFPTICEAWVPLGAVWGDRTARGTVSVNMHTTCGPAPGQVGHADMRNVEQTLVKSWLDLQIPGAVLLSSHAGVVHLLKPLPMAVSRGWRRGALLGHPRCSGSGAAGALLFTAAIDQQQIISSKEEAEIWFFSSTDAEESPRCLGQRSNLALHC